MSRSLMIQYLCRIKPFNQTRVGGRRFGCILEKSLKLFSFSDVMEVSSINSYKYQHLYIFKSFPRADISDVPNIDL
jgi:hypothetical protein